MKKLEITLIKVLGLFGVLIWSLTILVRESSLMSINIVRDMSYIAPNIGATMVAFYLFNF